MGWTEQLGKLWSLSPCAHPQAGLAVGPAAGGHLQRSSDINQSALLGLGSLMSNCHADAAWEAAK